MSKKSRSYSFYCDLNQIEKEELQKPTQLMRELAKLGSIYDLEIDLGQQEIKDGEVIDHPVLHCKFESYKTLAEIHTVLSEEFYVIDEVLNAINETTDSQLVRDSKFKLHELMSELSLINFQQQRIVDWQNPQAKANCEYLDLITRKLMNIHKQEQMVSLQSLFEFADDYLIDLAIETKKSIKAWTQGGEYLIEEFVLEKLIIVIKQVLSFIARESIESEEERNKLGKPPSSQIILKASKYSEQVEIEISCDGSATGEQELGSILQFIKPKLEFINGKVVLRTAPDQGLSFKLLIRETISQLPCEVFNWQDQSFALPLCHVDCSFEIDAEICQDMIKTVGHHFYLSFGDRQVPAIFLDDVLDHNSRFTEETYQIIHEKKFPLREKSYKAFEINLGFKHFALLVEAKTSTTLLTISQKPCPPLIVFSGKGVMESGQSAFILDVFSIGEHSLDLNISDKNRKKVA